VEEFQEVSVELSPLSGSVGGQGFNQVGQGHRDISGHRPGGHRPGGSGPYW